MYFRNRKRDVYNCLSKFYVIEFRLRGSLVHGCMSMVLMSIMIQTLTEVIFSKLFPLLQMTPLILPTMSMAAEKTFRAVMLLLLLLLANYDYKIDRTWSNNDYKIDRTLSSSNSNWFNHD